MVAGPRYRTRCRAATMTRPLVYIAGPITGDPWGCVRRAVRWSSICQNNGCDAYLPQLSVLQEMIEPQLYEYWINLGLNMLSRCDGLIRLSGDSPGADREVEYAKELGLPIIGDASALGDEWDEWIAYVWAQHAYRQETDR